MIVTDNNYVIGCAYKQKTLFQRVCEASCDDPSIVTQNFMHKYFPNAYSTENTDGVVDDLEADESDYEEEMDDEEEDE